MSLRDELAEAIDHDEPWHECGDPDIGSLLSADMVLSTPAMQAIRKALRRRYSLRGRGVLHMRHDGLPESVIDWVLDGETA